MSTRFGKFVQHKSFSYCFLVLVLLGALASAWQLEWAVSYLLGRTHIWGLAYLLTAVLLIVSFGYDRLSKKRERKLTCCVKILTCICIYNLLFQITWFLIARILPLPAMAEAVVTVLLCACAGLVVIRGYGNAKKVETVSYAVSLKEMKGSFRIALISDLHLGMFVRAEHVQIVAQRIRELDPDVVIIAGDLIDVDHSILDDHLELRRITKEFRKLSERFPVYFSLGNHDPSADNKVFRNFLKDCGIQLLHNSFAEREPLILAGRSDAAANERKAISQILPDGISKPVVLIDHDPQGIREAEQAGIPLVLCGHTHRGQFAPIGFFTKWANGRHCFYGHETFGDTQAIISSGAGYFNLPIRIGSRNEVVEITIN